MEYPKTLDDWNYKIIEELVSLGIEENEIFDFKVDISGKIDNISCSFANTNGGFIVIGIADQKHATHNKGKRIKGFPTDKEIKTLFYNKIKYIQPSISFEFKEPPISIPDNDRVLHVCYIPKSQNRPHMSNYSFFKRNNGNSDKLNYLEVRKAFYDYEERIKSVIKPKIAFVNAPFLKDNYGRPWEFYVVNNGDKITNLVPYATSIYIDDRKIIGKFLPKKESVLLNPGEVYHFYTFYELSQSKDLSNRIENDTEIFIEIKIQYYDELALLMFNEKIKLDAQRFLMYLETYTKGQPDIFFSF